MSLSFKGALKEWRLRISLAFSRLFQGENHALLVKNLQNLAAHYRSHEQFALAKIYWTKALQAADANRLVLSTRSLGMYQVLEGVRLFQNDVFRGEQHLFEVLSEGQHPEVLFITCSDSRIDSYHITQMRPGELFVLRNAGNIVPAHGCVCGGEEASIEFAVSMLGVTEIIICGHSHCGAMRGLLDPSSLTTVPAVARFLENARETGERMQSKHAHLTGDDRLLAAVGENVLVQLEHLKTHAAVAKGLAQGTVHLHGWLYKIETGEVLHFDCADQTWKNLWPLDSGKSTPLPS